MVDYLRQRLEIEDAPIFLTEAIGGLPPHVLSPPPLSPCLKWCK